MFRLPVDSLAIWDTRLRRLTILDAAGGVGRVITPNGVGMRPQIMTVLPDGSTLFEQEIVVRQTPSEYVQGFSNYLLFGPEGVIKDSLPVQPRIAVAIWGDGPLAGPALFDEGTQFAGDGDGYWIGWTRNEELRRYSLAGELEMLVRWPVEDLTVDADAFEIALAEELASVGPGTDPDLVTRNFRSRAVPERYPTHGPLVVDDAGLLWAQEFVHPGAVGATTWRVFDPDGVLISRVAIPGGHRVLDIGRDHVLASGQDDLGVEYVRLFRLTRAGPS
jgi:hypothetical protein